jgi:hypothetical protein
MGDLLDTPPPIFVVGLPRSATTWLGQLIGSHPDIAYSNEPDMILEGDYPFTTDEEHSAACRAHLASLLKVRHPRAMGHRPVFPKSYRSAPAHLIRKAILLSLKAAGTLLPALGNTAIPDLCDMVGVQRVIKSVSMLGRARAWNAAAPNAQWVLILRHPCGHAHSTRRGQASGRLGPHIPLGFEVCPVAARYGITRARLEQMTESERIAWRWAILNENAMEHLEGAHIISHDVLCAEPLPELKQLIHALGISWHSQIESFLSQSTARDGSYFQPTRLPQNAARGWRDSFEEQDEVLAAIADTRALALFT